MKTLALLSLVLPASILTSCVDFDDATQATSVTVQLLRPSEFAKDVDLSGKTVVLRLGSQSTSALTDAGGVATFTGIAPDVYDISTSWSITAEEYVDATGTDEAVMGATVSGSLNSQLISGAQTFSLATHASADRDIVIGKVYFAGSRDNNNRTYVAGKYIEHPLAELNS